MGRIVASALATLDGIYEDPLGIEGFELGGWALDADLGEEGRRIKLEEMLDAEALLFGRVTYETQLEAWRLTGIPDLVAKAESLPKFVVSSTLEDPPEPNTTVMRGDPIIQAGMLKDTLPGTILLPGSSQLMGALFEEMLLDEIRIMVYPALLGTGKPLFPPGTAERPMRLAHGDSIGEGIAYFVFAPRDPTEGERVRKR